MGETRGGSSFVLWIKLALAAGLIAWLVTGDRFAWHALRGLATPRALGLLALSGALVVASQLVAAKRWQLLSRPAGLELPLSSLFAVNYVGLLFNNFVLGGQGGDVVRLGLILRAFPERRAEAGAILVLDRVIGVAGLCLSSAALTLACWAGLTPLARWGGVVIILGGLCLLGLLWAAMSVPAEGLPLVGGLLQRVTPARLALGQVRALRDRPATLLASLVISVPCQFMGLGAATLCALALGLPTHPAGVMWGTALIGCANLLPITPGNLGVAEVVSQEVFVLLGSASGATLFAVYRVVGVVASLPALGLLFLDVAGVRSAPRPGAPPASLGAGA